MSEWKDQQSALLGVMRGNGHENFERGWLGDGTLLCLPSKSHCRSEVTVVNKKIERGARVSSFYADV